ncbi:hypothetical protein [Bacillus subtilis]|uniref:hypothetical protein n=1 Tax=Bacillus subtilis TaxID=1423 RepID=UPI001BEE056A|nr:hypothetical protein BsBEST3145_35140 [Bacillus subtilis]
MKNDNQTLKRTMTSRHIMMMALGGAIGAGLFKGSSSAIDVAGPSVIIAYLLGGIILLFIMQGLAEMGLFETVTPEPSVILSSRYWEITLLTFWTGSTGKCGCLTLRLKLL